MVLAGGRREGRRDGQDLGPGEHQPAVELREAQVVADRHPHGATDRAARDHLVAGQRRRRLAVGDAADLDVEHVQLAVDGVDGSVGKDEQAGVVAARLPLDPLDDAAGEDRDPPVAGPAARRLDGGAVERLRARGHVRRVVDVVPLLGEDHQASAGLRRPGHEGPGHLDVAARIGPGRELHRPHPDDLVVLRAHRRPSPEASRPRVCETGFRPRDPRETECRLRSSPRSRMSSRTSARRCTPTAVTSSWSTSTTGSCTSTCSARAAGCPMSTATLVLGIEAELRRQIPEVEGVITV